MAGKLTVSAMLLVPLAVAVAPPAVVLVQAAEVIAVGKLSLMVAPVTSLGPVLLTVMV